MKKKLVIILTAIGMLFTAIFIFLEVYTAPLPEKHGQIQTKLFIGNIPDQPLIVGFGGGEGGMAWASDYWKSTRNKFLKQGYAFLAVGYFGMKNTSNTLDRISLNAIYDSIIHRASHPAIDKSRIALIGGSKGGELVLNLAARFPDIDAVVGIVPAHVSFPAHTLMANTSSWTYNGNEVPFAPAGYSTIGPALKGDLHTVYSLILKDKIAVEKAVINVEKINAPILLMSAKEDSQWPSTYMSEQVILRLDKNNHPHYYEHIAFDGDHEAPLQHFDKVITFLNEHFMGE